jgi:hypothetical protein
MIIRKAAPALLMLVIFMFVIPSVAEKYVNITTDKYIFVEFPNGETWIDKARWDDAGYINIAIRGGNSLNFLGNESLKLSSGDIIYGGTIISDIISCSVLEISGSNILIDGFRFMVNDNTFSIIRCMSKVDNLIITNCIFRENSTRRCNDARC